MPLELCPCPYGTLTPERARKLAALWLSVWPHADQTVESRAQMILAWRELPEQRGIIFCLSDGDELIGTANTFVVSLRVGGKATTTLALGGVCVTPGRRGGGYGKRLALAAFGRVEAGDAPFCLFQTGVPDFYTALGCRAVDNRVVNRENPETPPFWDPVIMVYPAGATLKPDEEIELDRHGW